MSNETYLKFVVVDSKKKKNGKREVIDRLDSSYQFGKFCLASLISSLELKDDSKSYGI